MMGSTFLFVTPVSALLNIQRQTNEGSSLRDHELAVKSASPLRQQLPLYRLDTGILLEPVKHRSELCLGGISLKIAASGSTGLIRAQMKTDGRSLVHHRGEERRFRIA